MTATDHQNIMVDNAAMSSSEAREYMDKMKVRNLLVMYCTVSKDTVGFVCKIQI